MADVPTAVTGIPVQTLLATQPSDNSILPRAVIRFAQAATMPALGAGDVNIMTFTGVLPPNYAYQVRDLRIGIFGPNEVDVDHVEAGSFFHFVVDGVIRNRGALWNFTHQAYQSAAQGAFQAGPASGIDFFAPWYLPEKDRVTRDIMVGGNNGDVVLTSILVDNFPTTAAMTVHFQFDFLQYTIEQGFRALIHSNMAAR